MHPLNPHLVISVAFVASSWQSSGAIVKRQVVDEDDAVIIDAGGGGGIPNGPGPSVLGSVDKVFKAVKDFDQYQCIERMVCEYMQDEGDVASALLSSPTSLFSDFESPRPHRPPRPRPPQRPPEPPGLLDQLSGLIFGRRRRRLRRFRRQSGTNVQGNIIRLFQATGMDSLNLFPYVRAALIGHATRGEKTIHTRRGSSCANLYRRCPSRSDEILNYLNNHNGGLFNQVEPSVNQEVTPILSAIVSDMLGQESQASTPSEPSPILDTADAIFTSAVLQEAGNFLTGNTNSIVGSNGGGGILDVLQSGASSIFGDSVSNFFGRKKK